MKWISLKLQLFKIQRKFHAKQLICHSNEVIAPELDSAWVQDPHLSILN